MSATQIRCPFCNAAQAPQAGGQYTCEYCLQPFSVVDARREESRLLEEIQSWVQQKIGAAAFGPGGVDASSRAFIFQQRVLPDIKRDVDRAIEAFGTFGQFALVPMPIATSSADAAQRNPLVNYRSQILSLKNLRARLSSEHVSGFAVGAAEQTALQSMDRKLAELVHLSNVADAATSRRPEGYAAARRNLEALLVEVDQSLTTEGRTHAGLASFLQSTRRRYERLVALCRVCEELCTAEMPQGRVLGDQVDAAAADLETVAVEIENANYAPADTMPLVVGVRAEAAAARVLARWLRCYEVFTARAQSPFLQFVQDVVPVVGGAGVAPEVQAERLEVAATVLRAHRGEPLGPAVPDFNWVQSWAEAQRARKALGLFGVEEQLAQLDSFMAPVWVAEVAYSRAQGSVFTSGVETRSTALVDACAPAAAGVVFLDDPSHPYAQAMAQSGSVGAHPVALPLSTPSQVVGVIAQALRSRPGVLNPRVNLRGLAFMAGAAAHYASAKGASRALVSCCNGFLPLDPGVVQRVRATQFLTQRYG